MNHFTASSRDEGFAGHCFMALEWRATVRERDRGRERKIGREREIGKERERARKREIVRGRCKGRRERESEQF